MEKSYGKDVQITLSWERFVLLLQHGRISKEELSRLRNRGRVLFTNDFVETPVYMRPSPKTLPKPTKEGVRASCAKLSFKPATTRYGERAKATRQNKAPWRSFAESKRK